MAIIVRDRHLEEKIDQERQRRGDATQAKTLSDIAREYLTQLECDRGREEHQRESEAATA